MTFRRFWIASLALAASFAAPVRAEDAKPAAPTVVVRLKSFDGLFADAKYLAELAGKSDKIREVEGILKALPIGGGLANTGLDTKKPFLFYAVVTPDAVSSYAALMLPLADEKAFGSFLKDTLGGFGVNISKDGDGIYTVPIPNAPVEAYFTVANDYVYITAKDKSTLAAGNLFAPAKLMAAGDNALVSASVRIDQVPDMLKQMALQQLDVRVAEVKDQKNPGETPTQSKLRKTTIDFVFNQIRNIVRDGGNLEVKLVVDRAKEDLSFDVNLTGKAGSTLAKDISSLAERASLFASTLSGAMDFGVNVVVPAELREMGMSVIQEAFDHGIKNEKDAQKRALAKKAFETLSPIAKAGVINFGVGVRGPDSSGHYTIAFGVKVPDGKAIENFLKDDIVPLIPQQERSVLKLDAATVAGQSVHRIIPPAAHQDEKHERIFGKNAAIHVAFAGDRIVGSIGANSEAAVKSALEAKSARNAPPVALTMSVVKMAPLMHQEQAEAIANLGKKTEAAGRDLFTVKLEGGPALRFKVTMKALGITFLSKVQDLSH